MLQKYQETLKRLLDGVLHSSGGKVPFSDYINSVGTGIALLLILVLVIILILSIGFIPTKGYKFIYRLSYASFNAELEKIDCDFVKLKKYESTAKKKMVLFWAGIVVFYIPFAIPTVLYILTLLTGLF